MNQTTSPAAPRLFAQPLKSWERAALKSALGKAGLPTADIEVPEHLFWRFETDEEMPVGFGGLELHGSDALLRSVVVLPPLRRRGFGASIVAALETEAALHHCGAIWLLTESATAFFDRLGFAGCDRAVVPEAIRATQEFAALCSPGAHIMLKMLKQL